MNVKKTEGSVFHVLLFSLPVIISQACDSLMMLTDRYLLAQVNPIFAAAAMSGGMTAFLFWIFGAGLLGFVTALLKLFKLIQKCLNLTLGEEKSFSSFNFLSL